MYLYIVGGLSQQEFLGGSMTIVEMSLFHCNLKSTYVLSVLCSRDSFVIEILPLSERVSPSLFDTQQSCPSCPVPCLLPASSKRDAKKEEPRDRKNRGLVCLLMSSWKQNKIVPNDLSWLSSKYTKKTAMASLQQAITLRVLVAGTGMTFKISLHPSELT